MEVKNFKFRGRKMVIKYMNPFQKTEKEVDSPANCQVHRAKFLQQYRKNKKTSPLKPSPRRRSTEALGGQGAPKPHNPSKNTVSDNTKNRLWNQEQTYSSFCKVKLSSREAIKRLLRVNRVVSRNHTESNILFKLTYKPKTSL
jgi:ribosomal protein L44E